MPQRSPEPANDQRPVSPRIVSVPPPGDGEIDDDVLASLVDDEVVMLKLTLPTTANLYAELVAHPRILRVVALSGGYSRAEANTLLARNEGVVASFSRALTEGLSAQQTEAEFNDTLDASIESIYQASIT